MTIKKEIWRNIFDSIKDPAFIHDEEFRVIAGNAAYFNEAGLPETSSLGKFYWEVFPIGSGPLPMCARSNNHSHGFNTEDEVVVGSRVFLSSGYTDSDELGEDKKRNHSLHILKDISKTKSFIELANANQELLNLNRDRSKRAAELEIANTELIYQSEEKAKRAAELVIANKELSFQKEEKAKRAAELEIANEELAHQVEEKAKRAAELEIANTELIYQSEEKAKRAAELVIANKELSFQNDEKAKRAAELVVAIGNSLNNEKLQLSLLETIGIARQLVELRDPYTAGHEKHVGDLAKAIAGEMGFDAKRQEAIMVTGYLHDIGKIVVPIEILCKPGKLADIEYKLVQTHVQAGYDLLKNVNFPWPVARAALEHHERMDGSGYPNNLKGDEISMEGRILAVADVVDAIASFRPYRAGLGVEKALTEIELGRNSLYDPLVVDACIRLFREKDFKLPS